MIPTLMRAPMMAGLFLVAAAPARSDALPNDGDVVPGQYIVVLEAGTAPPEEIAAELLGGRLERLVHVYRHALTGFAAELSDEQREELARDPRVRWVEPDRYGRLQGLQSPAPWNLDRIDQHENARDGKYDYGSTGQGVLLFVVDSGIRKTHVEFGGRASYGIDLVNDGMNGEDCTGHGTGVASVAGGTTLGVAKGVSIVSIRIANCLGFSTNGALIAAVDWITARKYDDPATPMVANLSLGGAPVSAVEMAIGNSIAAGVTYVVSAGNDSSDACGISPARIPAVLTVGASTMTDHRASFSNYGPCLDLFAPGTNLTIATPQSDNSIAPGVSGTSEAAPHVAGVAAMYLEQVPTASPASVTSWILSRATTDLIIDPLGSPNRLLYSAVPPAIPHLTLAKSLADELVVELHWAAVPGAQTYDVVGGSLSLLRSTDGDFVSATNACLVDQTTALSLSDPSPTDPDSSFWYLVRASASVGPGTYDSPAPPQQGLRDTEIAASGFSCP